MVRASRARRHEVTSQGNREGNRGQCGVFPLSGAVPRRSDSSQPAFSFSPARCKSMWDGGFSSRDAGGVCCRPLALATVIAAPASSPWREATTTRFDRVCDHACGHSRGRSRHAFRRNASCRAPRTCGSKPHSTSASGSNNCCFRRESRSTERGLFEPATAQAFSYLRRIEAGNEGLVDQTGARWNHLVGWLQQVAALRRVAS